MTDAEKLTSVRRAYARKILSTVGVEDPRIQQAFAEVPREAFLGPGPWPISRYGLGYVYSPSDDPVHVYTDDLIGIAPERHINNGEPSLHAHLLWFAQVAAGDHVVHVGTGTGYYTAIMAFLTGGTGRVTGIELEPDLAARAKEYLAAYPYVTVMEGDGTTVSFDPADVIYVNAGATGPADIWLDRLKDGGRMILPLTTDEGYGAVFAITRNGDEFSVKWASSVAIYPCAGMRDRESERALAKAFDHGGWKHVTRLYRSNDVPDANCWLKGPGWCLGS